MSTTRLAKHAPVIDELAPGVAYGAFGFNHQQQPSSSALERATAALRAHYGGFVITQDVVPVIMWRAHPLLVRLPEHMVRSILKRYVFVTPLTTPDLCLVWYVQGMARGDSPDWFVSRGSSGIYYSRLESVA